MKKPNPNSMLTWWPRVAPLPIPTPRTALLEEPVPGLLMRWLWQCEGEETLSHEDATAWSEYLGALRRAAQRIGYPVFLRTDHTSHKHAYEASCFLLTEGAFSRHLYEVIIAHGLAFGMPDAAAMAVREWLDLDSSFTAFNGMPVAAERRYFVRDGRVECHHPYWASTDARVTRVIQGSTFTQQFLSELECLGWEASPAEHPGSTPAIPCGPGWTEDAASTSHVRMQLNQKFGLPLLETKVWQEHVRYLGCLRALYCPATQRFSVRGTGPPVDGDGTAAGRVEQVNSLRLDLLDADAGIVRRATITATAPAIAGAVDGKGTIGIQESREVGEDYWIVFHAIIPPGDSIPQIYAVTLRPGPLENAWWGGRKEPDDWRELLAGLNHETAEEVEQLTSYAECIGHALPGYWSVDFARERNGEWYLIDMATGEASWHSKDCPERIEG